MTLELKPVLEKTSSKGLTISIGLERDSAGMIMVTCSIDGGRPGKGTLAQLHKETNGCSHYLAAYLPGVQKSANVGVTPTEATLIEEAVLAWRTELAATPEGILRGLRAQRRTMIDRRESCYDEAEARYERLHAKGETDAAWKAKLEWEAKAEQVVKDIAAFDAAHPEVIASIREERAGEQAELAQRAEWA